jgi:hypothetical protein
LVIIKGYPKDAKNYKANGSKLVKKLNGYVAHPLQIYESQCSSKNTNKTQ